MTGVSVIVNVRELNKSVKEIVLSLTIMVQKYLQNWPDIFKINIKFTRVINFNFLFQSLTRNLSYSIENLAFDSLLR